MAFLGGVGTAITLAYGDFANSLPFWAHTSLNIFLISLVIVIYSILIWNFYRFVARKNIITLNLKKYNSSENPLRSRLVGIGLYTLEYIIILPFLVVFWFIVFTAFLVLLTQGLPVNTILIISTTVLVAIRMTAYYKEDLSKDLAKLLPFTVLGIAITQSRVFDFNAVLSKFFEIPSFFNYLTVYIVFIIAIELILRFTENFFITTGIEEIEQETEEELN